MAGRARQLRPEPFLWLLFSSGGVVAALFLPAMLFLFAVAIPLGWAAPDHDQLLTLLRHPITRVVLLGVFALSLFHWAHRFRSMLSEGLRLKPLGRLLDALCYGGALAGSLVAGYLLLLVW